jgi:hypothetical protein
VRVGARSSRHYQIGPSGPWLGNPVSR